MLPSKDTLTRTSLRTPKAAAIAGIIFSILLTLIVLLLRLSVPTDPLEPGAWLETNSRTVALAMNLVPFDGVAFLWFIGVLRDRLGRKEDRFFSTVFFGSGLLFLAMLFTAAAIIAAIIFVFATEPNLIINSATYRVTRTIAYDLMNVYAIKMAAVFMVSTSTVTIFTDLAPRWIAFLGFGLAAIILFVGQAITWSIFILPTWVFLISTYILIDNLWPRDEAAPSASGD
jgi:MFS family permease